MISTAPAVCCGYFSWPRTVVAVYIARENDPSVQEMMMEYSQLGRLEKESYKVSILTRCPTGRRGK